MPEGDGGRIARELGVKTNHVCEEIYMRTDGGGRDILDW